MEKVSTKVETESMININNKYTSSASRVDEALTLLRGNKGRYDIVICDITIPGDIDGFSLLKIISSEMNIPVIMTLVGDDAKTITKGITNGACDYFLKPVKIEKLKKIWQHTARKSLQNPTEEMMESVRTVKRNRSEQSKIKEENSKTPRFVWDPKLQNKFINAVESLGLQSATPKKIMEIMNIPGLSTRQISSHLQIYRNKIQRSEAITLLSENQQTSELDQKKGYSSSTVPDAFASPSFISEMIEELTSTDEFELVDVGKCSTVNKESEEYASLGLRRPTTIGDLYHAALKITWSQKKGVENTKLEQHQQFPKQVDIENPQCIKSSPLQVKPLHHGRSDNCDFH
ncbi:Two-component response regulator ARR10 [Acorus gramineus]|uniref:Two-component response regulator ARR10 n=1 Tax=Acorus gramineus TaxID=55184 RepID=A0AAV9BL96_ACOGR|nr:Two-component response regulator ARR10 [Acorus gramineus]